MIKQYMFKGYVDYSPVSFFMRTEFILQYNPFFSRLVFRIEWQQSIK